MAGVILYPSSDTIKDPGDAALELLLAETQDEHDVVLCPSPSSNTGGDPNDAALDFLLAEIHGNTGKTSRRVKRDAFSGLADTTALRAAVASFRKNRKSSAH